MLERADALMTWWSSAAGRSASAAPGAPRQRGASVVVLDRAEPPAGATRVAAGMLAPVGELAFGEPELLRMTLAAAELYPDFVAELEAASELGTGYVAAAAPSTSPSTATRRRSCAASTTCSARSASAPSGCRRAAAASWSRA